MECSSCGRANRDDAKFCDACGRALHASRPAADPRAYTPRHLVERQVARPARTVAVSYMWSSAGPNPPGRALQWWLSQLGSSATRRALLENHHHF